MSASRNTGSFVFAVLLFAAACPMLIHPLPAFAQPARRWVQASQPEFQAGKRENIALSSIGELTLARSTSTVIEDAAEHVWALATDSKGLIYAAGGSRGEIYKIQEGKSELLYLSEDPEILSLAVDKDDNLYAGTAPGGRIYKFTPEGRVDLYLASKETYIWAMAFDSRGVLYAATGDGGKLLKISERDSAEVVFESADPHLLDVVIDSRDNVYIGTSRSSLVFRIDPQGKAFAVFDSEDDEMHALAVDANDNVYVCTADGMQPGSTSIVLPEESHSETVERAAPGPADAKEADVEEMELDEEDAPVEADEPVIPERPARETVAPPVNGINSVYKITPNGIVTTIFRREGMALLSMVEHDGNIYVGTGNEGQLLKISPDLHVTILAQLREPQIPALAAGGDGALYLGTASPGKVYKLETSAAPEGVFASMVRDVGHPSEWGVIRVSGDIAGNGQVLVSTRTGNVAEPDNTWSVWSDEQPAGGGAKIASPTGRFIQYRLKLLAGEGHASPTVRSVETYYLPPNYRPRIMAIDFSAGSRQQPLGNTGSVAATNKAASGPLRGQVEIRWQAEDPNEDTLEFEVSCKAIDETAWKTLADKMREPQFAWNTMRVPDGIYRLKIRASDRMSNTPARVLSTEETSEPLIIDNTPPSASNIRTQILADSRVQVTAELADDTSPIQDAAYSVNSGTWALLSADDGMFDSRRETVTFVTEPLAPGEHTIVINVREAAGNVGAGRALVVVE